MWTKIRLLQQEQSCLRRHCFVEETFKIFEDKTVDICWLLFNAHFCSYYNQWQFKCSVDNVYLCYFSVFRCDQSPHSCTADLITCYVNFLLQK